MKIRSSPCALPLRSTPQHSKKDLACLQCHRLQSVRSIHPPTTQVAKWAPRFLSPAGSQGTSQRLGGQVRSTPRNAVRISRESRVLAASDCEWPASAGQRMGSARAFRPVRRGGGGRGRLGSGKWELGGRRNRRPRGRDTDAGLPAGGPGAAFLRPHPSAPWRTCFCRRVQPLPSLFGTGTVLDCSSTVQEIVRLVIDIV
jgi:hypothetical protein